MVDVEGRKDQVRNDEMKNRNFEESKSTQRKPSYLKRFMREHDVTREDVEVLCKNLLFKHTPGQLSDMLEKSNGGRDNLAMGMILDRVYGKSRKSIDLTSTMGFSVPDMTSEDRNVRIKELLATS